MYIVHDSVSNVNKTTEILVFFREEFLFIERICDNADM